VKGKPSFQAAAVPGWPIGSIQRESQAAQIPLTSNSLLIRTSSVQTEPHRKNLWAKSTRPKKPINHR